MTTILSKISFKHLTDVKSFWSFILTNDFTAAAAFPYKSMAFPPPPLLVNHVVLV